MVIHLPISKLEYPVTKNFNSTRLIAICSLLKNGLREWVSLIYNSFWVETFPTSEASFCIYLGFSME